MNSNKKNFIRINADNPVRYKNIMIEKQPELVLTNNNYNNNNYSFTNVENSDNCFYFFTDESYGLSLLAEYAYVFGLIQANKFAREKKLVGYLLEKKSSSEVHLEDFNKNLMNRVSKIESNYNSDIKAFQRNLVEKVISSGEFFNNLLNQNTNESVSVDIFKKDSRYSFIFEILSKYIVLCAYYLGSSQLPKFVDTFKLLNNKKKDWERSNNAIKNNEGNYVSSSTFIILKQKKEISESIKFLKENMSFMNKDLENKNKLSADIENLKQRKKKYEESKLSRENLEREIANMDKQVSESTEKSASYELELEAIKTSLNEQIKLKEKIERELAEKKQKLKEIQNLNWTNNNDIKLSEYQSKFDKIDNYQKYKNYMKNIKYNNNL